MQTTTPIHALTFPEFDSADYSKARYHYLLQIVYGETLAIDYCKRIAEFAPTESSKEFLLKQQEEEDMHLELLTEYVSSHPRPHVSVSRYFSKVDTMMFSAIENRDYITSIFIQNFLVEGLVVSLLKEFVHHTDVTLSDLSKRIVTDEVKHMEFGVREVKSFLAANPDKKKVQELMWVGRKTFLYGASLAYSLVKDSNSLGIPMGEFSTNVVNDHMKRLQDSGFPLSIIDRVFFGTVRAVLRFL